MPTHLVRCHSCHRLIDRKHITLMGDSLICDECSHPADCDHSNVTGREWGYTPGSGMVDLFCDDCQAKVGSQALDDSPIADIIIDIVQQFAGGSLLDVRGHAGDSLYDGEDE